MFTVCSGGKGLAKRLHVVTLTAVDVGRAYAAEQDWRPARASEQRVRCPRVDECGDDLHGVGCGRICVDLRYGIDWIFGVFEVLREERLTADGGGVVEKAAIDVLLVASRHRKVIRNELAYT
jgi:hypothetical protein